MFKELNKNTSKTIKEGIELEKLEFIKLKELEGKDLILDGFFFTNGDYGKQLVVVSTPYKVNMPARAIGQFEAIANDEEMLKALLDGKCKITNIRSGKAKRGNTTFYDLEDC